MQKEPRSVIFFTLLLFVVGVGLSFAAWDGKTKTKPSKTEIIDKQKYFLIENEANLAWFADSVNSTSGTININAKLMAPLDMGHKLFMPIASGSGAIMFGGVFDGNNQTISNLYLNSEELGEIPGAFCPAKYPKCNAQNVGLVGVLNGGTIKNLNLQDVDILAATNKGVSGGKDNPISVGPFVGFQRGGTVENCFVTGEILTSGKGNSIGGLVGNAWKGSINNSLSTVDVWVSGDESYVGGVVGSIREGEGVTGGVSVDACVYDGSIIINSGNGTAGGVVGYYEKGALSVSRSYFDTDIIADGLGKIADSLTMEGTISSAKNINIGKVVCDLNGGQWANNACSKEGSWGIGAAHITLNGISLDANGNMVYQISFNANEGAFTSGAKYTKFLKAGDLITADEISTPIHGDTVFGGWALTSDAAQPTENLGTVKGPQTIYAYWKTMYLITFDATTKGVFDADGEAPSNLKKKLVAAGDKIDVDGIGVPRYAKDGTVYYFAGWAATEDATEALNDFGAASEQKTFYAVWVAAPTYVVTFNTHGFGTTEVYVQENARNDQTVAQPENPEATGYEFEGWFGLEDGDDAFDFSTIITGDTVIHAKWSPVDYTITYELNGGKNNSKNPASYNIKSESIELKNPSKTGYTFEGWYYDKKFSMPAVQITEGSTGDKSLFAKWSVKTFPIVYMAGSYGVEVVPSDVKQYDVPINLRGASYTREGYLQNGWSTKNGGSKVYELDAVYKQNSTLTLYPYWVEDPTYKKDPSSIRDFASVRIHGFGIVVQNRVLEIVNVRPGAAVSVMDMQGRLIQKGVAGSTGLRVTGLVPGNYVVRVNGVVRQARIR